MSEYVSPLGSIPIIDETNAETMQVEGESLGYMPRDYDAQPPGTLSCCEPMPQSIYIPRTKWRDLIEDQEQSKSSLFHVRQRAGIETKSQNGTNYCWAFGTVAAVQLVRAANGQATVALSPTAVAAQVKNYRNVGGNTFDAIPHIAKYGVPPVATWPLNKIDRRYDTPEMRDESKRYRLTEWYELPSNDFDAAASLLLRGVPVILGLMWWSHMVCGVQLVALPNGGYGILIENSHGTSYGENGLAVLVESKSTAFDQAAPRVMTATELLA